MREIRPDEFERWEAALRDGSFEDAFAALEEAVAHLEAGELRLAEAVRCFEIGTRLSRKCERMLDEAELRISVLESESGDSDPLPSWQTGPSAPAPRVDAK